MLNTLKTDESDRLVEKVTDQRPEETRRMKEWLKNQIDRGATKKFSEIITLTPVLAQLLLDRNPINRPLNKQNLQDLASDILTGKFQFNGVSVVISDTGILMDGQHRCLQVITTGMPIETVIVFGPKEAARYTIDIGKSKTVSNFLAMKGRVYTHILAAVCNYHLQWRKNGAISHSQKPTKQDLLKVADELKGVDVSIEFTYRATKTVGSHAVIAFCHYVFWKRSSREGADQFILKLIEGENLRKGDPILYCRNRLIGFGRGTPASTRIEVIFKCWNAFCLGHSIDYCKISGGKLPKLER